MREYRQSALNSKRAFSAVVLLLLFMTSGALQTQARPMPVNGLMEFTFPSYTSIHNCERIDDAMSPAECIDFLKVMVDIAQDSSDPDHQNVVANMGSFGAHPLLLGKVSVLSCSGDNCHALKPVRGGPPEGDWQPPNIRVENTQLIYPKTGSYDGHQLMLSTADRTWKSDIIKDFWSHEFLTVRFDEHIPGQLIVQRDWQQTLTDSGNYDFILNATLGFALFWLGFMIAIVVLTPLISLPGRWPLRMQGLSILAQAIGLILALPLMGLIAPLVDHDTAMLSLAIPIYLGSAWTDRWLFNRLSHQVHQANSRAWRLIVFTKLAIVAIFLMGWVLLETEAFGGVG